MNLLIKLNTFFLRQFHAEGRSKLVSYFSVKKKNETIKDRKESIYLFLTREEISLRSNSIIAQFRYRAIMHGRQKWI